MKPEEIKRLELEKLPLSDEHCTPYRMRYFNEHCYTIDNPRYTKEEYKRSIERFIEKQPKHTKLNVVQFCIISWNELGHDVFTKDEFLVHATPIGAIKWNDCNGNDFVHLHEISEYNDFEGAKYKARYAGSPDTDKPLNILEADCRIITWKD